MPVEPGGIPIGVSIDRHRASEEAVAKGKLLRYDGSMHMMVCSGSGGGKTIGMVVPTALTWTGSLVVLDVKGEVAALTAGYRQHVLGQKVVFVGPGYASIDPLAVLEKTNDKSPRIAAEIAGWLKPANASEGGNAEFFTTASRQIVEATLQQMMWSGAPMTFEKLRSLLLQKDLKTYVAQIAADTELGHGVPAAVIGSMGSESSDPETFGNIVQSLQTSIKWLSDPSLSHAVSGGLDPRALMDGNTTVYVIIEPTVLQDNPGVARVILGSLISARLHAGKIESADSGRTLFLLDEMPQLKKMDCLMTALNVGRGYGITLAAVIQSLAQLEEAYGKTGCRQWLDSTDLKILMALRGDTETLDWTVKMLGKQSIETISTSDGGSANGAGTRMSSGGGLNSGSNTQSSARDLLTVHELTQMPPHVQIVLRSGYPASYNGKPRWPYREDLKAAIELGKRLAEEHGTTVKPRSANQPAPVNLLAQLQAAALPLEEIVLAEEHEDGGLAAEMYGSAQDRFQVAVEESIAAEEIKAMNFSAQSDLDDELISIAAVDDVEEDNNMYAIPEGYEMTDEEAAAIATASGLADTASADEDLDEDLGDDLDDEDGYETVAEASYDDGLLDDAEELGEVDFDDEALAEEAPATMDDLDQALADDDEEIARS